MLNFILFLIILICLIFRCSPFHHISQSDFFVHLLRWLFMHAVKNSSIVRHLRKTHDWQKDDVAKLEEELLQVWQSMRHLLNQSLYQTYQATITSDLCTERLAPLPFFPLSTLCAAHFVYKHNVPRNCL